jgi:hypothetical protein
MPAAAAPAAAAAVVWSEWWAAGACSMQEVLDAFILTNHHLHASMDKTHA